MDVASPGVGYYSLRSKKWPATETLWGKPLGCFYCVVSKFISLGREPVEDFFPTILLFQQCAGAVWLSLSTFLIFFS
jgi:hypothetical protein